MMREEGYKVLLSINGLIYTSQLFLGFTDRTSSFPDLSQVGPIYLWWRPTKTDITGL